MGASLRSEAPCISSHIGTPTGTEQNKSMNVISEYNEMSFPDHRRSKTTAPSLCSDLIKEI